MIEFHSVKEAERKKKFTRCQVWKKIGRCLYQELTKSRFGNSERVDGVLQQKH